MLATACHARALSILLLLFTSSLPVPGGASAQGRETGALQLGPVRRVSIVITPLAMTTTELGSKDDFAEEGWTATESAGSSALGLLGGIEVTLGDNVSVGLTAMHRLVDHRESYARGGGSVHYRHSESPLVSLLMAYQTGILRLGAGIAGQRSSLEVAAGECACVEPQSQREWVAAGLVEGGLQLPVSSRVSANLRVQRYLFRPQSPGVYFHTPDYSLPRVGWVVGLGAGFHFNR